MFGDMMGKLQNMKAQMDKIKETLDSTPVKGNSPGNKIEVIVNGNRKVLAVKVEEDFRKNADNQEFEDYLIVALNNALDAAERLSEKSMQDNAGSMLPNIKDLMG